MEKMADAEFIFTREGQLNWLEGALGELLPWGQEMFEKSGRGAFFISLNVSVEGDERLMLFPVYTTLAEVANLPPRQRTDDVMGLVNAYDPASQIVVVFYDLNGRCGGYCIGANTQGDPI